MDKRQSWKGGARRTGRAYVAARALEDDREAARTRPIPEGMSWKRMDLHLHTPASSDYRDPGIKYLDILKQAGEKGLDMIALTDHNTVNGYAAMHREIETLTLLERLGRLTGEERTTLDEYRRLLSMIVVLPGFEFTATFGFHILGIFPENTSIRKLEHLLLNLNVPEDKMVIGAPDAGSTSDVLTAYQAITAAGGLAIAAHANSSNGVAMQGFPFGGQTKIAYTQDPNLAALEVTDLESPGRRITASFYNGSKPEYPRRMHCIQGSDAHSLLTEQSDSNNKRLGVGARITEILVREASFAALKEVLTGSDFTRTRPYKSNLFWEGIENARQEGPSLTQSFHERAVTKTSRTRPILHDVMSFANGEGGTIYVGANPDARVPLHGLERPEEDVRILKEDIRRTIEPPLDVDIDVRKSGERGIIVINVPEGDAKPYVFAPTGQIYVRYESGSVLAGRDDIVRLVLESATEEAQPPRPAPRQERPTIAAAGEPLSPVAATPPPQPTPPRADRDDGRDRTYRQPIQPIQPVQPAASQSRLQPPKPIRNPALANLPPEKIRGQVRPMFTPAETPDVAARDEEREAAIEQPVQEAMQLGVGEFVAQDQAATSPSAEPAVEGAKPKRATRGRTRRKVAEEPSEPEGVTPTAEPMEATVAAEHRTREEIVAAEEERPKRGARRRPEGTRKKLEAEAPTAAAAASDAGEQALLVEAAVEPGAQIPAELEAAPAPLMPAEKKTRSRRKTAAQKAAEAEAPVEAAAPPEEAPAKAKGRGRGRKPALSGSEGKAAEPEESPQPSAVEPPDPPTNGVEITETVTRDGTHYHTMRDLRNFSTVHNVTRKSARRLWHYAILQHEHGAPELSEVLWHPELPIGVWRRGNRAGALRYDLVSRYPDGSLRIFYGVTEEGLTGPWAELVGMAAAAGYEGPDPSER